MLQWEFDDAGEWTALSGLKDGDGERLSQYRIQVCADGTFDVSRSDPELKLQKMETLHTLRGAKRVCEDQESELHEDEVT